ncbi:acyl-CoA dehydrogenase family protein [Pseudofrankia sp. BMG5.36]|uniref:acyl-CoA dehydrogenase family protein n=1 Tax=Pseudofrankia sp. BMG5.36 TaxID=1834512 RepID=UPI0009F693A8|nr:acyl-CoA dehydrogenase family protein [Pseudofrankia sp. BMG5.36]
MSAHSSELAVAAPADAPGVDAGTDEGADEELRAELRAVSRDLLAAAAGKDDAQVDWALLAEAGWLGLEVPDGLDGAGVTVAETAVVCEELGRAAARAPYLGTAVLGAGALLALDPGDDRDELLRALATGAPRFAVALPTGDAPLGAAGVPGAVPFRLARSGGAVRLTGRAEFVPDAAEAETLLLLALDEGDEPVVVRAAPGQPGVEVTATPVLDVSRSLGTVAAVDAPVEAGSVWRFRGDGRAGGRLLLARGALAVACDSLGAAEAMLAATVEYASVRHQFGRPIGSFQAVKHGCADMLVSVSVGRGLVTEATRALAAASAVHVADGADGVDDAAMSAVEVAVSRAKSYMCAAAVDVAGKAMQLHGGIGYTWESGVHRYLKRAALSRALFGSPTAHRARLARHLDADGAGGAR